MTEHTDRREHRDHAPWDLIPDNEPSVLSPDQVALEGIIASEDFQHALAGAAAAAFYTDSGSPEIVSPKDDNLGDIMCEESFRRALHAAAMTVFYHHAEDPEILSPDSEDVQWVMASDAFREALNRAVGARIDTSHNGESRSQRPR